MNPVMIEGKTYYLPLPGQYSGYILNKTLTEKLGLPIPATNMDLLALFGAGKEQGVGAGTDGTMFGIDTITPAAIGSYIIGTRVPDFLGLMDGIKWMDGLSLIHILSLSSCFRAAGRKLRRDVWKRSDSL